MNDFKIWKYDDAPEHWQALARTDIIPKLIVIVPKETDKNKVDRILAQESMSYEYFDFFEKDIYITY